MFIFKYYIGLSNINIMKFEKKICVPLLVLFFFLPLRAQKIISKDVVNHLLQEGDSLSDQLIFNKSLQAYKKASSFSKKINFQNGAIESDLKIARTLNNLGFYKDSFKYLDSIEKKYTDQISERPEFKYQIIEITGLNYLKYDFKREAVVEFRKLPPLVNLSFKENTARLNAKIRTNVLIASCYEFVNNDTAYHYMRKAESIIKSERLDRTLDIPKIFQRNVLSVYRNLADYQQYFSKNLDSAYYYSDKVLALGEYIKSPYMYIYYRQRAQILHSDKKHKQSLVFCRRSLKIIKEKAVKEDLIDVYKLMYENYTSLGDEKNAAFYRAKYVPLKDSLVGTRTEGIIVSSDHMNSKKKMIKSQYKNKDRNFVIVGFFVIIFFIFIIYIVINRKKQKELKENIELKKKKLLEKENETQELKLKVKEGFEEVVLLAKTNSPEFVTLFISVYPDFYQALLTVYPDINTENLKFCALLRLSFSSKDIATYNFITPRAIQLRKNRLRKKLGISSTEDIYGWLNRLDNK